MDPKLAVGGPKPISGTGLSGVEEILWKWFSFVAFGLGTSAAERGIGTILLSALWSREKQDIDARGWWVGGGGREWTEAGVGKTSIQTTAIFQALADKGEAKAEWDGIDEVQKWEDLAFASGKFTDCTGVWSLLFSGSDCKGEQGERSNGTEKDNAREGEHLSRGNVWVGENYQPVI